MTNSLLTINMVTRKALSLFLNSNAFLQQITRTYDDQFARTGAKIGETLRVRLPNSYVTGTGATVTPQSTSEQQVTMTVATQANVAVQFTSVEKAMSLDDYSTRILEPAMNNLSGYVGADVMTAVETGENGGNTGLGGIPNFVHNTDASNNTISPTMATWLTAGSILDQTSAPKARRKVILDEVTQARTLASLAGLFNPSAQISKQYELAKMGTALGFDWYMDQTVVKHTVAAYSTLGTVSGGSQTGSTITVSALAGPLNVGDIISFGYGGTPVESVNRVTYQSNGTLMQFVVTAAVAESATSIPIYPALIPTSGNPNTVPYATVNTSPASGGAITSPTNAGETYRKNFVFLPEAVTMVTADLYLPSNAVERASRQVYDGVSLRMIEDYITLSDLAVTRVDVLYGAVLTRPEWCVTVADAI